MLESVNYFVEGATIVLNAFPACDGAPPVYSEGLPAESSCNILRHYLDAAVL
jgi:hypothetical protein